MRGQRAHLAAVVMCAVLVGAAPAHAQQATWSAPDTVPGSEAGGAPALEAGAAGVALGFLRPRRGADDADVLVSRRSGFGDWVTAEVSDPAAPTGLDAAPALAISRSGTVAAAWLARPTDSEADPRIDLVLGSLNGDLQRRTISAAVLGRDADNVTISVDDAGQAVLGWTTNDGRGTRTGEDDVVRARSLLVGSAGAAGAVGELSAPSDGDIAELRSRSTPAGDVVFGWVTTQESEAVAGQETTTTTRTRVGGARGRPGAFQAFALPGESDEAVTTSDNTDTVLTRGERLQQVRVGVADDGRALLAFQRFRSDDQDEPDRPTDVTRIETLLSAGSVAGGFALPIVHDDAGRPDDADELPLSLDVAADGDAIVAGLAGPDGREAFAATGAVTGELDPASPLGAADEVDAAARGAGRSVALATGAAGVTSALDGRPQQPIAAQDANPNSPVVDGSGDGSAVAAWQLDPMPLPMNVGDEAIRFADLREQAPAPASPPPEGVPPPASASPPPPPPAPVAPEAAPEPPAIDTTAPEIHDLSLSPDLLRVGPAPSAFRAPLFSRAALHPARRRGGAAGLARGGALRFALSESAWVRFTISRMVTRRGGRSRCPKGRRRRGGPVRRVGMLQRTFAAGPQSLAVSGRIRRDALSRGRYVLRLRAVDPAGNLSPIVGVRFTVC